MISDGRGVADGSTVEAEVCIVGGGAAGIAMALTLARAGRDVVVIESGGEEFDEQTNDLNRGELVGEPMEFLGTERPIDESRRRFLGGSTNCWFGWCRPMDPSDFENRPWIPVTGWPFRRSEIEPFFAEVADWVEIGPATFDPADWAAFGAAPPILDTDLIDTTMFQFSEPTRFGSRYLSDLESTSNLRVVLWSNAMEIETDDSARRVIAVAVTTFGGNRFRVVADQYVLATGGIEIPRLLLVSTGATPNGLGNGADLVGRYFMEHPYLPVGMIALGLTPDDIALYLRAEYDVPHPIGSGIRTVGAAGAFRLTGEGQRERSSLSMYATLSIVEPGDWHDPDAEGMTAGQVASVLSLQGAPEVTVVRLHVSTEQLPQPVSRVSLGNTTDQLGMPRVHLDWHHDPLDRDTFVAGLEVLAQEVGRLGLGRVVVEPQGVGPWDMPFTVQSHHMGTARMADDPDDGVVDADCRVHGTDNLYLAGSAVFPTSGSVNPTFTILALALRLAAHIHSELP